MVLKSQTPVQLPNQTHSPPWPLGSGVSFNKGCAFSVPHLLICKLRIETTFYRVVMAIRSVNPCQVHRTASGTERIAQ